MKSILLPFTSDQVDKGQKVVDSMLVVRPLRWARRNTVEGTLLRPNSARPILSRFHLNDSRSAIISEFCGCRGTLNVWKSPSNQTCEHVIAIAIIYEENPDALVNTITASAKPASAKPRRSQANSTEDIQELAKFMKDTRTNPKQSNSKDANRFPIKPLKQVDSKSRVVHCDDKLKLDEHTKALLKNIAKAYAERRALMDDNSLDIAYLFSDTVSGGFPDFKIFRFGSDEDNRTELPPRSSLWRRATLGQREINAVRNIVQPSVGKTDFEPAEYLVWFEFWFFLLHKCLQSMKCHFGTPDSPPLKRGPDVGQASFVFRVGASRIDTAILAADGAKFVLWALPIYLNRKSQCAGALLSQGVGLWYTTRGESTNPTLEEFKVYAQLVNRLLQAPATAGEMLQRADCRNMLMKVFPSFYTSLEKQRIANRRPPIPGLRFTLSEDNSYGIPEVTPWIGQSKDSGAESFTEISWEKVAAEGSVAQQILAQKLLLLIKNATVSTIKQSALPYDVWLDLIIRFVGTGACYWRTPEAPTALSVGPAISCRTFWEEDGDSFSFRLAGACEQGLFPCTSWFIPMYVNERASQIGPLLDAVVGPPLDALRALKSVPRSMELAVSHQIHLLELEPWVAPISTNVTWHDSDPILSLKITHDVPSVGGASSKRSRILQVDIGPPDRCKQVGEKFQIHSVDKNTLAASLIRVQEIGFAPVKKNDDASRHVTLVPSSPNAWQNLRAQIKQLRKEGYLISSETEALLRPLTVLENNFVIDIGGSQVKDKMDWFSISLSIKIEDEEVNLLPILIEALHSLPGELTPDHIESLNDSGKFNTVLPDGRLVSMPFDRIQTILLSLHQFLRNMVPNSTDSLLVPALQAWHIRSSTLFGASSHRCCEKLARRMELANVLLRAEQLEPATEFQGVLREYQKIGLWWLDQISKSEGGGILADDMGLGKTVQVIAKIQLDKINNVSPHPVLIVCTKSMLSNWTAEFRKFAPEVKVFQYTGAIRHQHKEFAKDADVVLTSYGLLLQDTSFLTRDMVWHGVYLDEAQRIKNSESEIARAVKELISNYRVCVTGTPIENNYGELWSHFNFLMPGFLNERSIFNKSVRFPAESGDKVVIAALRAMTRPYILRRLKSEVRKDLPEKIEMTFGVELTGAQADLYEALRLLGLEEFRTAVAKKGFPAARNQLLTIFHKLRQVCAHPALLKLDAAKDVSENAKFDALFEKIEDLLAANQKILIFSSYVSMLQLIGKALKVSGIPFVELTGEHSAEARARSVQKFQATDVPVFLISLQAGGEGLNLVSADTVILYEPWWTSAKERQAVDRAHRIGQVKTVSVFRFIAVGTIEERMVVLQKKKQALSDMILDSDEQIIESLTKEDVEYLFGPMSDFGYNESI